MRGRCEGSEVTVPGQREEIDGAALRLWGGLCLDDLEQRRAEINALNVFPVADADTGTNLLATMRAAVRAADAERDAMSAHRVAAAMARGATAGARGNSGIILSQVLRGIAEATTERSLTETTERQLTATTLRAALRRAAALVRESLSVPVEGTILTVLECAADCASACAEDTLAEVAVAAADGAAKALGDTPSQLGVLRAAGVVDAGARGLVVLLDALVAVTLGETPTRPDYLPNEFVATTDDAEVAEIEGDAPHFEVMYQLADTDLARVTRLRERLAELGDSVVVVGDGGGNWSAHVHCADAGAAVEAGLAAGALRDIRIESFAITAPVGRDHLDPPRPRDAGPADRDVLAVAAGSDAAALFEAAGATVLGAHPVTSAALLTAIRRMPHREVLVLPNGALPAHELVAVGVAARDVHRDVLLLPSGSMVQGLAALAVHDRGRIAVDDAFAMSEAAAATRWGSLRAAAQRALTMVGTCEPGDGLGLVGHDVVVIDRDVRGAALTLLDRMLGLGGELVTLLMGVDAPAGLAEELSAHIARGFPGVEVTVYSGGQQGDLAQIGVE
ncbi:DAK2 domain-containing protein [Nocardia lijiangensis]|uniref:DAK2 domain-containing protein n=1 Tax=Nocardia lijiangensis TaxID=299618 RepID=UPI00082B3966|nr:DAK2 domain-containing protein [Nocardia lijiangensis]